MACKQVKIASPVAVRSANFRVSIAAFGAARSAVGDTSTVAVPAKATTPRFTPGVSPSMNALPAAWAALSRVGATSVESIDSDTSIANITVARLRGTLCRAVGPANATVSPTRATRNNPVGTCRAHPCRFGATRSSNPRFANRIT